MDAGYLLALCVRADSEAINTGYYSVALYDRSFYTEERRQQS